jgi:regulation of enolase protein 1 (concanavalin A-like superfamily)
MSKKLVFALALACSLAMGAGVATAGLVGYWPLDEGLGSVAKDASGNGHNGTVNGTANWVDGPDGFRSALTFGTGGGLGVDCGKWNPSAATNQVTIACWVNWLAGGSSTYQGVVCNRTSYGSDDTQMYWAIELSTTATTASLQFGSRTGSAYGLGNLTAGQWQYLTVTFDGTTVTTYINGSQVGSGAAKFGLDTSSTVRIGASEGTGNTFNGSIDDVRIYDTLLATTEMTQLMNPPVYQTSSRPTPSNGAQDVRRDVILGWTAASVAQSHDVYFGMSFDDVNNASRTNPGTALVSQGQDANSFDLPGMLAIKTAYYWRVDEVNASSIYKGNVWSFTTEPFSYKLGNITATASSSSSDTKPQYVVDGSGLDAADLHGATTTTMWLSNKSATQPAWIQFEFDRVYKLSEMWIWNYNSTFEADFLGFGINVATVTYSTDGTNWSSLGDLTFNQGPGLAGYACNTTINLGIAAKYVKIAAVKNFGTRNQYGLSEVRFFYIPTVASEPKPASGATEVAPNGVVLGWRGGRDAVSHKVLFGTDSNAVSNGTAVLGTTDQTTQALDNLDLGKTYYWQIDEVNDAGTPNVWTGNLWSFSTANFIGVDNMESYTDDQGRRIFDTWVDGWGTSNNGSQVGYSLAPFAEKGIIHGGKLSMPFAYNNVSPIKYSEAERTWTAPVDWTTNKADTLRLFVQGRPASFAETSTGTISMSGAGTDIYQTTDQFRYAYKQLTGNGSITARIDSIQNTNEWAKAGVMIRQGLTAGVVQAHMIGTPSGRIEFMPRLTAGASATGTATTAGTTPMPQWVRVTRNGNVFTGEYSSDGKTWTQVTGTTPATIVMTDPVCIGLVVNSHIATTLCEVKFSSVSTTGNVTGAWQLAEVGVTQPAGNTADTLYVTVKDSTGRSATVANADPAACITGTWQEWCVPFSSFSGVSMNRITSMIIGVGDKTNPKQGTGLLFIDDIGVGHP